MAKTGRRKFGPEISFACPKWLAFCFFARSRAPAPRPKEGTCAAQGGWPRAHPLCVVSWGAALETWARGRGGVVEQSRTFKCSKKSSDSHPCPLLDMPDIGLSPAFVVRVRQSAATMAAEDEEVGGRRRSSFLAAKNTIQRRWSGFSSGSGSLSLPRRLSSFSAEAPDTARRKQHVMWHISFQFLDLSPYLKKMDHHPDNIFVKWTAHTRGSQDVAKKHRILQLTEGRSEFNREGIAHFAESCFPTIRCLRLVAAPPLPHPPRPFRCMSSGRTNKQVPRNAAGTQAGRLNRHLPWGIGPQPSAALT